MHRRITALVCGALFFTGCFKSVSYDTLFVFKPWMQQYNQYELASLPDVVLYAYAVDTAAWAPASYDDALAGVLTSRTDPSQQYDAPYATGQPFGEVDTIPAAADWLKMRLKLSSAMIVAVDTRDRLYAYTQQVLYENLSPLYVSVTFQPWRDYARYSYGGWTFVNDFYDPDAPKTVDYLLTPTLQPAEEAEPEPLAGVRAYAFAADTLEWRIASYEDAVAGIITSKTDPAQQQQPPTYTATPDDDPASDYRLRMRVTDETLMVVAVDETNRLYAYCKQALVPGSAPVSAAVNFCPWRPARIYVDGAWRMVNEFYVPPTPDPDPENPDEPDTPDEPAAQAKRLRR